MRAAILVPPAPGQVGGRPSSFAGQEGGWVSATATDASSAIIGTLLEDALSSSTGARRLVPLPAGAVTAVLAEALGIDANEHPAGVLMVIAGSHRLLDATGAEALGFDKALDDAARVAEDEVEAWISEGYAAMSSGDFPRAEACYLAADRQLGHETSPRRALVLASLGDIARAERRVEEAIVWLDRALAISPNHMGALRARAELALELGENAVAAALLHRLVDRLETDVERADTLSMIASQCLAAAGDAIRRALELHPNDRSLLERLRAVHEARGQWEDAVGVAVQLAEGMNGREQRARALVEAARLCSRRTGNTPRAVALYEAAIEDDPQVPSAFAAIENELVRAEDYRGVSAAYERQLERLENTDAKVEQGRILRRLAEVERDHLKNAPAALSAFERLVALAPDDAQSHVAFAELLASTRHHEPAVRELEVAAELLPSRFETYRLLYELFSAMRDEDRTYAASAALVALGEADINEQMTYAQHSPSSVLATRHRFDADIWQNLMPADHEDLLDRVTSALEPAAIELWLAEHRDRADGRVNERFRQHAAKTTVSAVRCAAWAAELLGVPEPAFYAQPDNDRISVATLPMREPALLMGRHVLAGRSVPELSFILARHLTYSRPGWRILTFYPQLDELEPLVRAGLSIACPKLPSLLHLDARTHQLKALLEPRLDPQARGQIAEAVGGMLERQARFDLLSWARCVETTACRAALLACGDASVATTALAVSGMPAGGISARDRALGLLPFAISRRHSALRQAIGVAVG
jgi:tetratricopeptide (TPR) repeat protein